MRRRAEEGGGGGGVCACRGRKLVQKEHSAQSRDLVRILKSQLPIPFTTTRHGTKYFSEFMLISTVSTLVHLLYKDTIESTFQNLCNNQDSDEAPYPCLFLFFVMLFSKFIYLITKMVMKRHIHMTFRISPVCLCVCVRARVSACVCV